MTNYKLLPTDEEYLL